MAVVSGVAPNVAVSIGDAGMLRNAGPESSNTGSLQGGDAAAGGAGVEIGGSGLGEGVGATEAVADGEAAAGLGEVEAVDCGEVLLAIELVPQAAVRQAIATKIPIALPITGERRTAVRGYRP